MSDLGERFQRWWCGQDLFDAALREHARRTEETLERHRALMKQAAEIERVKARRELRIEFAKIALRGILANPATRLNLHHDALAGSAWDYADAMLATEDGND